MPSVNNQRQWLWAPTFAGTTRGEIIGDFTQFDIPQPTIHRKRRHHRVRAADRTNLRTRLRRSHRRDREICERRRRARGRDDAVHPPYLGIADDPGNADPSVLDDLTAALDRLAPGHG